MSAPGSTPSFRVAATPRVIRGMVARCLLALAILTGIAVGGFWFDRDRTRLVQDYVTLANEVNRQRWLVNQVELLARQASESTVAEIKVRSHAELRDAVTQLEESRRVMRERAASHRPAWPEGVREIYSGPPLQLDRHLDEFVAAARKLSQLDMRGLSPARAEVQAIVSLSRRGRLLAGFAAAGKELDQASRASQDALRWTKLIALAVTLAVIAFTGLAVFRPMIREVRIETENFLYANRALDLRAAELAATLQELEQERDERRVRMQEMASMMQDLEEERGKLEREIQARQLVQDALEASEERSFAIIESAPTAMVVTNKGGQVVMANVRASELFGYDREEILGQSIGTLVVGGRMVPEPAPGAPRGSATPLQDVYCRRKDGQVFPVEIGTNPLEMEEGDYVLNAIIDITGRKRAEEEIKRINKELQRRNDEMQQFVYTISHDLKSPLVTCKGFMGLMKEDALAGRWDVVLDSVGRIERAIQRMGDLIEDLLQLSRIGVIRNEPEEVDVGKMVRAIADELADRLQQAGATLQIHDPLPHVVADRVRLAEVFENLLSNAIKYGCRGDNGLIEVGGAAVSSEIRFFVRDHGPGIAREFHRKVFGLFQRLESNQEGTGVGLAAVSRILETHGGRTWVESSPGEGATFWIAFPAVAETAAAPFAAPSQASLAAAVVAHDEGSVCSRGGP